MKRRVPLNEHLEPPKTHMESLTYEDPSSIEEISSSMSKKIPFNLKRFVRVTLLQGNGGVSFSPRTPLVNTKGGSFRNRKHNFVLKTSNASGFFWNDEKHSWSGVGRTDEQEQTRRPITQVAMEKEPESSIRLARIVQRLLFFIFRGRGFGFSSCFSSDIETEIEINSHPLHMYDLFQMSLHSWPRQQYSHFLDPRCHQLN